MATWVQEGKLEASLKKQIAQRRAGELPHTPPERELDVVLDLYARAHAGLRGPLNWYRTRRVNFDDEQRANLPAAFPAHIPALQLPAELDAALPPSMCTAPAVLKCFPAGNLEVKMLKGADHWCLQVSCVRFFHLCLCETARGGDPEDDADRHLVSACGRTRKSATT
jgi:soluble epoxide hydrolase/lipid-phosphate phosphatase